MDQLFDTIPSELTQHILQELKHKYLRESQSIMTTGRFFSFSFHFYWVNLFYLRDNPSNLYVILKGKVIVLEQTSNKQLLNQSQKNNILVKRNSIILNDQNNHENKKIMKITDEIIPKNADRTQLKHEINQKLSHRDKQSPLNSTKNMTLQSFQTDNHYEIQQNTQRNYNQNPIDYQDNTSILASNITKNGTEGLNIKKRGYSDSKIRYKLSSGNYFGDISLRNLGGKFQNFEFFDSNFFDLIVKLKYVLYKTVKW